VPGNIIDSSVRSIIFNPAELAKNYIAFAEKLKQGGAVNWGVRSLDSKIFPKPPGFVIGMIARPGHGKAQPLYSLIKTLTGWKQMGEVKIGDSIASIDGEPSTVEKIYPQPEQAIYELQFSDGRNARATGEHLWRVFSKHWEQPKTLTTLEVKDYLAKVRYSKWLFVELCNGRQQVSTSKIPIPAYLMGIILGDGCLRGSIVLTTNDKEVIEYSSTLLESGFSWIDVGDKKRQSFRLSRGKHGRGKSSLYIDYLTDCGLLGRLSDEKFIPAIYLDAGYDDRLELLRGLLDTDGCATKDKVIEFDTTSPILARQVQDLVRSLGGWCRERKSRITSFTYKGKKKVGKRCYRLVIRHPQPETLFRLKRKSERVIGNQYSHQLKLRIDKIERVGVSPCQCIKVSHPSQLYITDDYVVTHNTSVAAYLAKHNAEKIISEGEEQRECIVYVTLDQSPEEIESFFQCGAEYSVTDLAWGNVDLETIRRKAIDRVRLPIWTIGKSVVKHGNRVRLTTENIYTALRQIEYLLGEESGKKKTVHPRLIIIDFIQILAVPSARERSQQVGEAISQSKEVANELGSVLCMTSQAKRQVSGYDEQIPEDSDSMWAAEFEQVIDDGYSLWRPAKKRGCESVLRPSDNTQIPVTENLLVMRNWKQRFAAPGGDFYLHLDPSMVKLTDMETEMKEYPGSAYD
jgi:replicative DNA helicase